MPERPRVALVTGATGFVGSHLVEALVARGWRVRCLVRKSSVLRWIPTDDVTLIDGDVAMPGEHLDRAVRNVGVVFHLAALTSAANDEAYTAVNVEGTRNIVDAMLWILCTGSQWRDLPEAEFGSWETVYCWFNRWASDNTLDEILLRLKAAMAETESFDHELWCIDGSAIRAHRCASGGGKKAISANRKITRLAAVGAGFRRRSICSAMAKDTRSTSR